MLNISFTEDNMNEMQKIFNELLPDALTMTHYDIAKACNNKYLPHDWKKFLTHNEVFDFISQENKLITIANIQKIAMDSAKSGNAKSTGMAQTLGALTKLVTDSNNKKDGPAYIIILTPLTEREYASAKVRIATKDNFIKE